MKIHIHFDYDNLYPKHKQILWGKMCPRCYVKTRKTSSEAVYRKDYGPIWRCPQCGMFVGSHKKTSRHLGMIADKRIKEWRSNAHKYFDFLWKHKIKEEKISRSRARGLAYSWLSKEMGIPVEWTHISMFNWKQCKQVVDLCKPYYSRIRKNRKKKR